MEILDLHKLFKNEPQAETSQFGCLAFSLFSLVLILFNFNADVISSGVFEEILPQKNMMQTLVVLISMQP